MPTFQGNITPNALPFVAPNFAAAGSAGAVIGQHTGGVLTGDLSFGAITVNLPASRPTTQTFGGARQFAFYDDFYERIWLIPDNLDVGVITADITSSVSIWNSAMSVVTLGGVTSSGDTSATLSSVPTSIAPFALTSATVSVAKEGGGISNAVFNITYGSVYPLEVSGVRAKAWAFEPDWSSEFTTDYEFRTEIITSRDGTEQRIATRDKPRVSYAFSTLVDDYDFRNFAGFANSWQARPVLMPEWSRLIEVSAASTIGQSSVTVVTTDDWLVEGANVSITWGDRSLSKQIVMSVEAVVGSTVTFTAPLTVAVPAEAIITPMFYGRLDGTIAARHKRERTATVDVKFAVDPGYEQQITSVTPVTYDGRELFMLEPDLSTEITTDFTSMIETLDYGYGRIAHFTPVTYNDRVSKMTHLGAGRVEIDALRDLFLRQRGQQGEFFMPTFSEDLRMRSSLGVGQSTMRVLGAEVFENYTNLKVFRHICVIMRDGTSHRFKVLEINSITDSQGTDSTLTLQSAATSTINPADVFMVCWLPLWRFVSDKLTVQWRSDQVASVSYSMKTVPYVAAEA